MGRSSSVQPEEGDHRYAFNTETSVYTCLATELEFKYDKAADLLAEIGRKGRKKKDGLRRHQEPRDQPAQCGWPHPYHPLLSPQSGGETGNVSSMTPSAMQRPSEQIWYT